MSRSPRTSQSVGLVWHRRDLRLQDQAALDAAVRQRDRVLAVFVIDPDILKRPDTAPIRVQFMLACLAELQEAYANWGGRLVVRQGDPLEQLRQLAAEVGADAVFWNEDVEPYAIARDRRVREGLEADGIAVQTFQDMLLHAPDEIATQSGKPYSVYGPFWRNWSKRDKAEPYATPEAIAAPEVDSIALPTLKDLGMTCTAEMPAAGEAVALELLDRFYRGRALFDYDEGRNLPAAAGTSQLSPHLRWGTLGIRHVWAVTRTAETDIRSDEAARSLQTWRQELAWREFYKHGLYHWPRLETESFRAQFDEFEWENDNAKFAAWCRGETGYPIVDAAMRQLNQTGWMHNRCRMIVASFLTKDLLIDWRWGERYFMQTLVDGDLAANNGGWQWSASVGTDPKPLRIFNPSTQAKRYDVEGEYIRQYVPELAGLDPAEILDADRLGALQLKNYPAPIVQHKTRQQEFKFRYQACKR